METDESLVLIVDDDPTTRMLLRESLQAGGFRVEEAADGNLAVSQFKQCSPDMVLMDVVMPNMDGFSACRVIRQLPGGDRVPILVATSLEDLESINRAYEAGASDFVTKPINWALIAHRVRYMIRAGQTYQDLCRSEAKNVALLDVIPDLMCRIRSDGMFLEVKPPTGTPPFEISGDVSSHRVQDVLPEALATHLLDAATTALQDGTMQFLEFQREREKDVHHYEARIVVSGADEVLAILRDITRRKRMEATLRDSEQRFRSLIENGSDLIAILRPDGEIRYGSPSVLRTLGYGTEEFVGRSILDFAHEEDVPSLKNMMNLALSHPGASYEEHIRLGDQVGGWRTTETICTSMSDASGDTAIVVNSRDITERVEAELKLHDQEEQFRQAQKMEAIGRLAGGVAHDFNNLLTAILGYGQIVEDRLKAQGQPLEEIEEVRNAGMRATTLTRQLLTFSRRQIMHTQPTDLNEIMAESEKILRRLLGEDIELVACPAEDLGQAMVDPGQIEQVIMNLAVNARDAMPDGGRLTIDTSNESVSADDGGTASHEVEPGEYVRISVSDTGVGMDAETLAQVFEPFFTTKARGQGTGLGLSTVYGIIKQSSGFIFAESEPNRGTAIHVYLPRLERPVEKRSTVGQDGGDSVVGDETVLLAEDESWVRTLVRQCLEKHGYTVLEAEDGEEAIGIANRYKGPIHLLLTDLVMPRLNGAELAKQMNAMHPDTRVLYMSGYSDHAILKQDRIQSGIAFLQKPFTILELARKVRRILDASDAMEEAEECGQLT